MYVSLTEIVFEYRPYLDRVYLLIVPEFTVNISPHAHETLVKLAESSGEAIQIILDKAIENYRRQSFLLEANQAFVKLRENEETWQEELQERQIWEQTIADGLEEY